jgi:hypothetical protein
LLTEQTAADHTAVNCLAKIKDKMLSQ